MASAGSRRQSAGGGRLSLSRAASILKRSTIKTLLVAQPAATSGAPQQEAARQRRALPKGTLAPTDSPGGRHGAGRADGHAAAT